MKKRDRKDKAAQFKAIQDFKVRVLDFISIYVKQMQLKKNKLEFVTIVNKLVKALEIAHFD